METSTYSGLWLLARADAMKTPPWEREERKTIILGRAAETDLLMDPRLTFDPRVAEFSRTGTGKFFGYPVRVDHKVHPDTIAFEDRSVFIKGG